MSYKITVRVYQSDTKTFFNDVVEKTVWNYANGGTWQVINAEHVLTIGGSGTSGTLRFKSNTGEEEVIFALGVHNYKPWLDAVPDAKGETGTTVQAQYYGNSSARTSQREKQLTEYSRKGPSGRNFTVKFTVTDGHDLQAVIIIGAL